MPKNLELLRVTAAAALMYMLKQPCCHQVAGRRLLLLLHWVDCSALTVQQCTSAPPSQQPLTCAETSATRDTATRAIRATATAVRAMLCCVRAGVLAGAGMAVGGGECVAAGALSSGGREPLSSGPRGIGIPCF